ncbi:PREDICTED: endochitinase A-like [Amphimedon queenslandica]|uniref:Uncharacterized protein n=1 Tax=Amphimedon queenslandica TaxID=400682 RepID=A0AAN0JDC4_AMPQE|nr:PREDICTED: endochitinase A-like [Amphimedon queenslandica]|eukprot:XP_019854742.1 PREDICTED: endochitinase A-like [Amphimedon queenslandica]
MNEILLDPLSFTCCQHNQTFHCSATRFLNVIQSEPITSSSTIPSSSQCIPPSSSTLADADSTYSSSIKSIISSVDISPSSSITSDNEQLVLSTANTEVSTTLHTETSTIVQTSATLTANTDASSILHTNLSPTVQTDVPTTAADGPGVVTITKIMSSCPTVQTITELMSPSPLMTTVSPRGPEATANTFYECFNNSGFITFMAIFVLILIIQFLVCIAVILCCRYRSKKMKFDHDLTLQNNYQTQSADL